MNKEGRGEFVDRLLTQRLSEIGLRPERNGNWIETGYPGLRLAHGITESLKVPFSRPPRVLGSVEIHAAVDHPALGQNGISDLIGTKAPTPEEALTQGVEAYLAVTFPALRALFDPASYQGPNQGFDIVYAKGNFLHWQIVTGERQILQDVTGEVTQFLAANFPLQMMQQTLNLTLADPRLHWCKLSIARTGRVLSFGCSIDGRKSPAAEAEMRRTFGDSGPARADWEYRQFFALYPTEQPKEAA